MSITPFQPERLRAFAHTRIETVAELAWRICEVPAPTGSERERAEFVASLWRERGYVPEIDAIGNVYTRRGKQGKAPVLMLLAHTDTVFPPSIPIAVERMSSSAEARAAMVFTLVPPSITPTLKVVFGSRGTSRSAMAAMILPNP